MRLDKEDAVCVKAIHLLSHLLSLDLLEPEECVEVMVAHHDLSDMSGHCSRSVS